ncbi:MAG TPA: site-specific DNA-methyltransferase [Candidatus Desulfofervidus auxilii]|uniref:Methyltransferase n=1 Tax=Desulfofervidus auxilii TaxID=1621989 RepID=A0A7C0Y3P4_DESA2|nr:site-specific DNA-methyltransferase [Candidatus Desulfofervidus auxilii]
MSLFQQGVISLDRNKAIKVISDQDKKQTYTKEEVLNSIILGDALKVLKKLPEEIFDMVFIDPPYFLQLPKKELRRWTVKTVVEGVDDDWDKFSSFEEYDKFIQNLLTEVKRVMKSNATIWVIATYHSIFRIGKIMQDLGYWILNDIIWVKTNPMPNWLGVRFTNATETLIWAVKDKNSKKYTFNKDYAKQFGIGKIGANVWVLPLCNGKERLKDDKGKKVHSTQKPIELLKRVILTSTKEGDLILDPVAGVGTTGYVAKALNRIFVMIEINPKYVEWIKKRFEKPLKITDKPRVSERKINQYFNLGDKL